MKDLENLNKKISTQIELMENSLFTSKKLNKILKKNLLDLDPTLLHLGYDPVLLTEEARRQIAIKLHPHLCRSIYMFNTLNYTSGTEKPRTSQIKKKLILLHTTAKSLIGQIEDIDIHMDAHIAKSSDSINLFNKSDLLNQLALLTQKTEIALVSLPNNSSAGRPSSMPEKIVYELLKLAFKSLSTCSKDQSSVNEKQFIQETMRTLGLQQQKK